jgi:hypothetical protein
MIPNTSSIDESDNIFAMQSSSKRIKTNNGSHQHEKDKSNVTLGSSNGNTSNGNRTDIEAKISTPTDASAGSSTSDCGDLLISFFALYSSNDMLNCNTVLNLSRHGLLVDFASAFNIAQVTSAFRCAWETLVDIKSKNARLHASMLKSNAYNTSNSNNNGKGRNSNVRFALYLDKLVNERCLHDDRELYLHNCRMDLRFIDAAVELKKQMKTARLNRKRKAKKSQSATATETATKATSARSDDDDYDDDEEEEQDDNDNDNDIDDKNDNDNDSSEDEDNEKHRSNHHHHHSSRKRYRGNEHTFVSNDDLEIFEDD